MQFTAWLGQNKRYGALAASPETIFFIEFASVPPIMV